MTGQRWILRGVAAIGAGMLVSLALTGVQRAAADEPVRYELAIQQQPLSAALQEFAKQSGIQIIFFSKLTDGYAAPALRGTYMPEAALSALLSGTNLTFNRVNAKTIEVQP